MIEQIREWLASGEIDIFLGYKRVEGHALPHAFDKAHLEELADLDPGVARYPLEKTAARMAAADPEIKIGMLARDCNRRSLDVLRVWNQLADGQVKTLNVNCCPSNLKSHADCSYLSPPTTGLFKKQMGIDPNLDTREIEQRFDGPERFQRWMYEFQKCIKCYGCRDICPVCFCADCSLAHADLIGTGHLPPDVPIFHLVRAVHMAGRCVDCGLCEEACPAEIPLRQLYRKVNDIMVDVFDYRCGVNTEKPPFSVIDGRIDLKPKEMTAA